MTSVVSQPLAPLSRPDAPSPAWCITDMNDFLIFFFEPSFLLPFLF
jgi:hypothetical protein